MSITPEQATLGQNIGSGLAGLSLVFCSMEMVPGWSVLHLGWSPFVFICIMAVCGAVSGLLVAVQHRLAGLLGGLLGGSGALLAIVFVLQRTTWTHTVILLVVSLIGALPGYGVYAVLAAVENAGALSREQGKANVERKAAEEPQRPQKSEDNRE